MSKTETQAIVNAEIDLVETVRKANSGEKQSLGPRSRFDLVNSTN